MPNWCENRLQIVGTPDKVQIFKDENFDEEGLKFYKSVPVPEELGDWDYDWCIQNWGTKWDLECIFHGDSSAYDYTCSYKGICSNLFTYSEFNTAWCPPSAWLHTVAAKYPYLKFTLQYAESGCGFSGIMVFKNGECIQDDEAENGVYFGDNFCQACEEHVSHEDYDAYWDPKFHICTDCRDKSFRKIGRFVRQKKLEQLPKRLACMRIGRNSILDNYMMRKVFIPRLQQCVV